MEAPFLFLSYLQSVNLWLTDSMRLTHVYLSAGEWAHLAFSEFVPNCVQERVDMREPATPSLLSCPVIHNTNDAFW